MNSFLGAPRFYSALVFRVAIRLAAAALAGCQGRRCVRTHDFAPAFDTTDRNVDRCVVIGVSNEITPDTVEYRLRAAISFVDVPTAAAHLRRVGTVDFNERHTRLPGLVAKKRAELGERPRVQRGPLGLTKPYPLADAAQLLNGDAAPGAFSLDHDAFRDLVVNVGGKPSLLATALLQQPSCGTGLFGLQAFSQPHLPFSVTVEASTCGASPITSGGDVNNSHIYADEPVGRYLQRGLGHVDCRVEEPITASTDQIGLPDRVGGEFHQILWRGEHSNVTQPAPHRPDRDGGMPGTSRTCYLPRQAPRVKRLRRVSTEANRFRLHRHTPDGSGWAIIAGAQVRAQSRVGIRDLGNHSNRRLGRQPEAFTQLSIEAVLGLNLAEYMGTVHLLRQPHRRRITRLQRLPESRCLSFRRQHSQLNDLLHISHANVCHRQFCRTGLGRSLL